MPLFMSISGYCFQMKKPNYDGIFDYFKFLSKKFKRLIVPLVFVKYFYMMPIMYAVGGYKFQSNDICRNLLEYICNLKTDYLWYLWVLFAIFCVQGLTHLFDNRGYIFIIELLASFLLLESTYIDFFKIPHALEQIFIYMFWFILGRIIFSLKIDSKYIYFVACFLILILIELLMKKTLLYTNFTDIIWKICMIIMAYNVTSLISSFISNLKFGRDYSMGVYLFHVPIMYIILHIIESKNSYFLAAFLTAAGIMLSVIITKIVRYLNLNFILGENNEVKFNNSNRRV